MAQFEDEVLLTGISCSLQPWRSEFAELIVEHANNRKIWLNLLDVFPHPYGVEHAQEWIQLNQQPSWKGKNFAICVLEQNIDGKSQVVPVGSIGIRTDEASNTNHIAHLGYFLGENYWGRGIVSETVSLIVEYVFSDNFTASVNRGVPIERIEAHIFARNLASRRVAEKCGFVFEGIHKKAYKKDGVLEDGAMYAKFRSDASSL